MGVRLEPDVIAFLASARVAHLATLNRDGAPLVLPICFTVLAAAGLKAARPGSVLVLSLDEKPKRRAAGDLERVRNLTLNPHAAVVVDRWSEDWTRLAWVHLSGTARILAPPAPDEAPDPPHAGLRPPQAQAGDAELHRRAVSLLRGKYPQYGAMALDTRPAIALEIERVLSWGPLA